MPLTKPVPPHVWQQRHAVLGAVGGRPESINVSFRVRLREGEFGLFISRFSLLDFDRPRAAHVVQHLTVVIDEPFGAHG